MKMKQIFSGKKANSEIERRKNLTPNAGKGKHRYNKFCKLTGTNDSIVLFVSISQVKYTISSKDCS